MINIDVVCANLKVWTSLKRNVLVVPHPFSASRTDSMDSTFHARTQMHQEPVTPAARSYMASYLKENTHLRTDTVLFYEKTNQGKGKGMQVQRALVAF